MQKIMWNMRNQIEMIRNGRRLSVQADQNHYFNLLTLGLKFRSKVGVGCCSTLVTLGAISHYGFEIIFKYACTYHIFHTF